MLFSSVCSRNKKMADVCSEEDETINSTTIKDSKSDNKNKSVKLKKKSAGIIYLSSIPQYMTVKKVREIFSRHGEVDHVFLQPNTKGSNSARKRFTEGWIEFKDKSVAKSVAEHLNNTTVDHRKRSKWNGVLWNIKYLHRFKWFNLNERLAYEKAAFDQRMRVEIAQAKRETNFYIDAVEKKKKDHDLKKRFGSGLDLPELEIRQNVTEQEFRKKKFKSDTAADSDILTSIFGENM